MDNQIEALIAHDHKDHKLVCNALRYVARILNKPYSSVKSKFKNGNEEITILFWTKIYEDNPSASYTGVYCCASCKKFGMEVD